MSVIITRMCLIGSKTHSVILLGIIGGNPKIN